MPYSAPHLYLTFHWSDSREPDEGGQIGIRFDSPATDVTQGMVNACQPAAEAFWLSAGTNFPGAYVLRYLRLAHIGVDGKYTPGTFSYDYNFGTGIAHTPSSTTPMPLQVASVATFTTELPRGQASRGRIYLPPLAAALGTNGRWTATQVDARATAVATLLQSLNTALSVPGGGLPAIASVFSKGTQTNTAGLRSFIRGVKIGTRPDVQRRRAKSMAEIYGATKPVALPS
jgi:hypothetical protein